MFPQTLVIFTLPIENSFLFCTNTVSFMKILIHTQRTFCKTQCTIIKKMSLLLFSQNYISITWNNIPWDRLHCKYLHAGKSFQGTPGTGYVLALHIHCRKDGMAGSFLPWQRIPDHSHLHTDLHEALPHLCICK